jgi:hypothetical protein
VRPRARSNEASDEASGSILGKRRVRKQRSEVGNGGVHVSAENLPADGIRQKRVEVGLANQLLDLDLPEVFHMLRDALRAGRLLPGHEVLLAFGHGHARV